jgi:hypothetical protein
MPRRAKTSHDSVPRIRSQSVESPRAAGQPYASETEDYESSRVQKPRQAEIDAYRESKKK